MDFPVSAFEMYKLKKKSNQDKKRNKKNKARNTSKILKQSTVTIDEDITKKVKEIKENNKVHKKNDKNQKQSKLKNKPKVAIDNKVKSKATKVIEEVFPQLIPASFDNRDFSDVISTGSGESFEFTPVQTDSVEEGFKVFQWLIAPYNAGEFLTRVWEKKPLHIAREKPLYYKNVISTPIIDDMLRNENILFTKNIDITSYTDGKRETHNPVGRAHPHVVWDYYLNGCSIRLLNPQTYIPLLHTINATLQEFTHSFVGANAYLTPPDSQGFAPHYDDIEAFIMQIEGKKKWRVYKPLSENEILTRVSSKNFDQNEIGDPILEVTLKAGDMLYFPRGYIHQGITIDGEHSLHITVSMYQKHSWADLFEKLLPAALQTAITENQEFRKGLPFDIYENFGLVHSDLVTSRKPQILSTIHKLFDAIKLNLPIDSAVDEMSINYQRDALPPVLSEFEKAVTVYGDSDVMVENGKVTRRVEIELDTKVRLLRKNILRMVMEDKIKLYYYTENSLEYHGNDLQFLEIDEHLAPAVETLIRRYPDYVTVEDLMTGNNDDKVQLANDLWEKGAIMTEYPLENIED